MRELARKLQTTAAALRHDIARGYLQGAVRTGDVGRFTDAHLHQAMAVRALRKQGVRGPELARTLRDATPERIRALAGVPEPEITGPIDAVDALLWTAAEALDAPPRNVRAAVVAICTRMRDAKLTPEQVVRALTRKTVPLTSSSSPRRSPSGT